MKWCAMDALVPDADSIIGLKRQWVLKRGGWSGRNLSGLSCICAAPIP